MFSNNLGEFYSYYSETIYLVRNRTAILLSLCQIVTNALIWSNSGHNWGGGCEIIELEKLRWTKQRTSIKDWILGDPEKGIIGGVPFQ